MATIYADYIFKYIFFDENTWIMIMISLSLFLRATTASVQITAGRQIGEKPLSESLMVDAHHPASMS